MSGLILLLCGCSAFVLGYVVATIRHIRRHHHEWTNWAIHELRGEQQTHPFSDKMLPFTEPTQRRRCASCGFEQREVMR